MKHPVVNEDLDEKNSGVKMFWSRIFENSRSTFSIYPWLYFFQLRFLCNKVMYFSIQALEDPSYEFFSWDSSVFKLHIFQFRFLYIKAHYIREIRFTHFYYTFRVVFFNWVSKLHNEYSITYWVFNNILWVTYCVNSSNILLTRDSCASKLHNSDCSIFQ